MQTNLNRSIICANNDTDSSWLGDGRRNEELVCPQSNLCFVCERAALRSCTGTLNWKKKVQAAQKLSEAESFIGSGFTKETLARLKANQTQPKESFYIFDTRLGRKRRHDPFFAKHAETIGVVPKKSPSFIVPLNLKQKRVIPPSKQRKLMESNDSASVSIPSSLGVSRDSDGNYQQNSAASSPSLRSKSHALDEEWLSSLFQEEM